MRSQLRWLWVLSVATSIGCGRFGFDALNGDAGSDDAAAGDEDAALSGDAAVPGDAGADVDATPLGPFAPPTLVAELNTNDDELGPSLSADGTELYFTSDRDGSYTLYVATRPGPTGPFETVEPVAELDAGGIEYDADLSRDGLELMWVSSAGPSGIRRSTRALANDPWDAPTVEPGGQNREGPSLTLGDSRMVLSTSTGIEEWSRTGPGAPWQLLREHATLAGMAWPGVTEDGLEIYGQQTSSGAMFVATRASPDDAFGTPVELAFSGPFTGNFFADVELSPDGRTMFLSVQVGSNFDLYVTTR